jgi:hypothetical protein
VKGYEDEVLFVRILAVLIIKVKLWQLGNEVKIFKVKKKTFPLLLIKLDGFEYPYC